MTTNASPTTQLKSVFLKNPFAVLPAPTELTYPNGRVTPELLMHYKAFAQTEAALVITGPATVAPPNSRKYSLLRADQPKYLDGLRALTKIISSNGSLPGIHITHTGECDAQSLMQGHIDYRDNLDWINGDKLVTAFRNASQRACEVGFRYVELGACYFLVLQQIVKEDMEDLIREIFDASIRAVDENHLIGLRLHPECPQHDKYARLFIEMGGDIVAYQNLGIPELDQVPAVPHRAHSMTNLGGPALPDKVLELLKHSCLIGVSQSLHNKKQAPHFD